jgi:hypothetical protein
MTFHIDIGGIHRRKENYIFFFKNKIQPITTFPFIRTELATAIAYNDKAVQNEH